MPWRKRNKKEDFLCGVTHFLCFLVSLLFLSSELNDASCLFYESSALVFFASSVYHFLPAKFAQLKDFARKFDISTIYLLVPGTAVLFMSGITVNVLIVMGMILFALILLEVIGTKLSDIILPIYALTSTILCLIAIFSPWLLMSALLYGIGIIFYLTDHKQWNHFIWHLFVMAGWFVCVLFERS